MVLQVRVHSYFSKGIAYGEFIGNGGYWNCRSLAEVAERQKHPIGAFFIFGDFAGIIGRRKSQIFGRHLHAHRQRIPLGVSCVAYVANCYFWMGAVAIEKRQNLNLNILQLALWL